MNDSHVPCSPPRFSGLLLAAPGFAQPLLPIRRCMAWFTKILEASACCTWLCPASAHQKVYGLVLIQIVQIGFELHSPAVTPGQTQRHAQIQEYRVECPSGTQKHASPSVLSTCGWSMYNWDPVFVTSEKDLNYTVENNWSQDKEQEPDFLKLWTPPIIWQGLWTP